MSNKVGFKDQVRKTQSFKARIFLTVSEHEKGFGHRR